MIECPYCEYVWQRDEKSYDNIYGRFCPSCNKFIKPVIEPKFVAENKVKLELLHEEIRNKIRKAWR